MAVTSSNNTATPCSIDFTCVLLYSLDSVPIFGYSNVMQPGKKLRIFTLYHIVTTTIQEAVLIIVLLWLLPHFGIGIPIWLVVVLVLVWAAFSYLSYSIGKGVICKPPIVGPETMIGRRSRATTLLSPAGYVQSGNEHWRAHSIAGVIERGIEVEIVDINGLDLFVAPLRDDNYAEIEVLNLGEPTIAKLLHPRAQSLPILVRLFMEARCQ